jgi:DNA-binding MarR family transcriptional regulator/N-acetylglutamate synthase-like GNAT family acetyltransferase
MSMNGSRRTEAKFVQILETGQRIEAVRRFNRFYTKQIGLLRASMLQSGFSLTEARIIFEIGHQGETNASKLGGELDIDGGYLSRILRNFESRGLIERARCEKDGRQRVLRLVENGQEAFATLVSRSRNEVEFMLAALTDEDQGRLLDAMSAVEDILGAAPAEAVRFILRPHQPGDIGWVTHRHGVLYSEEYGWDDTFEALVARILSEFVENFDAKRERSWIAETKGEIVGSVFVAKGSDAEAKLRLLLVDPKARGCGLGTRLVDECIRFARGVGYKNLSLWTNDVLHSARRIYERAGFQLIKEQEHHSFGHDLVGQWWNLELR